MHDPLLGRQIDEYKVEALIGQGGMARVYRARDTRTNRFVTLKILDGAKLAQPDYIQRFHLEAQAIARLDHPNIVSLYRFGETEDSLYLAMQYVEGVSLAGHLRILKDSRQSIDPHGAAGILRDVASALDYAHSMGIVHRDIKPSNILLNEQGRAILSDFGLVLLAGIETEGQALGSPQYVAPEQVDSSGKATHSSDLYALGIVAYEMFVGHPPFQASTPLETARMHLTQSPPLPRTERPDLPPELERVLLKAIAKRPVDRYPSGAAFVQAVEEALVVWDETLPASGVAREEATITRALPGRRAVVPYVPPMERGGRRRWVYLAALVALLLLCGGLYAAIAAITGDDDEDAQADQAATTEALDNQATAVAQAIEGTQTVMALTAQPSATLEATLTLTPTSLPTATPLVLGQGSFSAGVTPPPVGIPGGADSAGAPAVGGVPGAGQSGTTLLVAKYGEDSLFVMNASNQPLALGPLRLGDGRGAISGAEWQVGSLAPNACVTAWKDGGNPEAPSISCARIGPEIIRDGPSRFWKSSFNVYYNETLLGTCSGERCQFSIG